MGAPDRWNSGERYLTAGEAARHCRVSTPAVRRWMREGQIRGFRTPGGHRRIALSEFQAFLREQGMPPYPHEPAEVRILIVDDEPAVVSLFVDLLSDDPRGFKLETANDGYEALIAVGSFRPAVLVLDALMPRLDGVEVCRRLKSNPETRGVKILGMTGYPGMVPALLAAGADACLTKPLDLVELQRELGRLLAAREGTPRQRVR